MASNKQVYIVLLTSVVDKQVCFIFPWLFAAVNMQ